jgi:hypothetical protein
VWRGAQATWVLDVIASVLNPMASMLDLMVTKTDSMSASSIFSCLHPGKARSSERRPLPHPYAKSGARGTEAVRWDGPPTLRSEEWGSVVGWLSSAE